MVIIPLSFGTLHLGNTDVVTKCVCGAEECCVVALVGPLPTGTVWMPVSEQLDIALRVKLLVPCFRCDLGDFQSFLDFGGCGRLDKVEFGRSATGLK